MGFLPYRWGFWVIAVAVTTAFAFGMSNRTGNWFILGIGAPLAVIVVVAVAVWSDHDTKSVLKGRTLDE